MKAIGRFLSFLLPKSKFSFDLGVKK